MAVAVAPVDVLEQLTLDRLVIRIVGAADDKAADRGEVAFDPVEPGAVGRQQDKLGVVVWHPCEHVRGGVGGEVVADDVESLVEVVEVAQLGEEAEEISAGAAAPVDAVQPIGVKVIAAE